MTRLELCALRFDWISDMWDAKARIRDQVAYLTSIAGVRGLLRAVFRRQWIPTRWANWFPVAGPVRIQTSCGDSFFMSATSTNLLTRKLCWAGINTFEPETVPVFTRLVQRMDAFVDVGANQGLYTLLAAACNPEVRVHSFEPVPQIFKLLVENIELNGYSARCTPVRAAVSNEVGVVDIHVPGQPYPAVTRLAELGAKGPIGSIHRVSVTSLDRWFETEEQIDLVKVDVEGAEPYVLEGMRGILGRQRPVLVVEVLPASDVAAMMEILGPIGYSYYSLREGGISRRPVLEADVARRDRNYLCVHPESPGKVDDLLREL